MNNRFRLTAILAIGIMAGLAVVSADCGSGNGLFAPTATTSPHGGTAGQSPDGDSGSVTSNIWKVSVVDVSFDAEDAYCPFISDPDQYYDSYWDIRPRDGYRMLLIVLRVRNTTEFPAQPPVADLSTVIAYDADGFEYTGELSSGPRACTYPDYLPPGVGLRVPVLVEVPTSRDIVSISVLDQKYALATIPLDSNGAVGQAQSLLHPGDTLTVDRYARLTVYWGTYQRAYGRGKRLNAPGPKDDYWWFVADAEVENLSGADVRPPAFDVYVFDEHGNSLGDFFDRSGNFLGDFGWPEGRAVDEISTLPLAPGLRERGYISKLSGADADGQQWAKPPVLYFLAVARTVDGIPAYGIFRLDSIAEGLPAPAPAVDDGSHRFSISTHDNYFSSDGFAVQAGTALTFVIVNEGSAIHNLRIAGEDGVFNTEDDAVSSPELITYGNTATLDWTVAGSPGTVNFQCDFHPTDMTGSISIE